MILSGSSYITTLSTSPFIPKEAMISADAAKWEAAIIQEDSEAAQGGITEESDTYNAAVKDWEIFSSNAIRFYRRLYREDRLQADSELMEDKCRIALRIERMLNQIKENDYKEALTTIKESIGICLELDDALRAFSHLYSSIVTKNVASPQNEMKSLIDSLYAKVDELVSQGFVNEARDVLAQIEAVAPKELLR